jgi:hypothetical protein
MMNHTIFQLSDAKLTAEVARLARGERAAMVSLIIHLAAFDKRRLYLAAAYPSLFAYCRGVLKLSEHEAYHRIVAARAGRAFPVVFELLDTARVTLTTVRLLAPHLTAENHRELLSAACGKSKLEVKELVAARFPKPDVRPSCRPIPRTAAPMVPTADLNPTSAGAPLTAPGQASVLEGTVTRRASLAVPDPPAHPVTPLSVGRYEIRFTASAATRDKLRMAQDLLRHAVPSGDPAEVFDRALSALLEDLLRKKFAATDHPKAQNPRSENTRHVPAAVKRAVWMRDAGRCAFEGKGRRCEERAFLEFHHVKPFAAGGEATTENMALRCRAHNAHEAELFYGPGKYNGTHVNQSQPGGWVAGAELGPDRVGGQSMNTGRIGQEDGRAAAQCPPVRST